MKGTLVGLAHNLDSGASTVSASISSQLGHHSTLWGRADTPHGGALCSVLVRKYHLALHGCSHVHQMWQRQVAGRSRQHQHGPTTPSKRPPQAQADAKPGTLPYLPA